MIVISVMECVGICRDLIIHHATHHQVISHDMKNSLNSRQIRGNTVLLKISAHFDSEVVLNQRIYPTLDYVRIAYVILLSTRNHIS